MMTNIISILAMLIFIGNFCLVVSKINKKEKCKNGDTLKKFLTSPYSEMVRFFSVESSNKDNFDDLSIANMLQFTYFREYCGATLYSLFMNKIKKEGIDWLKIPDTIKIKRNELENNISNIALEFANSDNIIDNNVAIIYANYISTNINDLEKLEKEAIRFNESFGDNMEGDPELHPKESETDQYTDEQYHETDVDTLTSTGTVEYLDD